MTTSTLFVQASHQINALHRIVKLLWRIACLIKMPLLRPILIIAIRFDIFAATEGYMRSDVLQSANPGIYFLTGFEI